MTALGLIGSGTPPAPTLTKDYFDANGIDSAARPLLDKQTTAIEWNGGKAKPSNDNVATRGTAQYEQLWAR